LIDNAIDLVCKIIPPINKEQQIKVLLLAQDECLKYGLTTVDDAGLPLEIINRIDSLQKSGQLKIKMFIMIIPDEETLSFFKKNGASKTERLNVSSMKLYADGALGSRGAALLESYSDDKNNLGLMLNDEKYFEEMLQNAITMNFQVCTHAIGDRANRFMLNLYGKYLKGKNDLRWRIEHAQIVHPNDWEKFSRYNIIPSVQPTHCTSDMYWVKNRLGELRMNEAYPYKSLLNSAGILPTGSDFPVEEVNPLLGFYAAITRQDLSGFPEGGFYPNERLTREEALKGMTIRSAYSNKEEKDKGSIAVGKDADFVILSDDIMTCNEKNIPKTKVKFTYVNGEKVYQEK
jgi:predicted amidohydrolase YtcJ